MVGFGKTGIGALEIMLTLGGQLVVSKRFGVADAVVMGLSKCAGADKQSEKQGLAGLHGWVLG